MDVVWTLVLEEGRGGFMDSSKYRQVMTDMFFRGVFPEPESDDEDSDRKKKPKSMPRSTKQSKLDELRAFNQAIAARAEPAE
jgi:hypothetical protein